MHKPWQGKLAVVVIVAVGVALASGAYAWWTMQGEALKERLQGAGAADWDEDKAVDELNAIAHHFQEALAEQKDTSPMLGPAQRLVEKHPNFPEARTLLAQVLRVQGRRSEAIEQLERSLALNARQPNIHEMIGQLYLEEQNPDRALYHFSQAMSIEPANAKFRLLVAQVHIMRQDYDPARQMLLHTLNLDSSQHKAYAMLSDLYARQNRLDLALSQIQRAIETTPITERDMQVQYIRTRAMLLRRANQPREALLVLQALTPGERAHERVMADMATCHAMLGQPEQAAILYELAFQDNPADFAMLEEATRWRIKAGDLSQAEKYLDMLRRLTPRASSIPELENQITQRRDS